MKERLQVAREAVDLCQRSADGIKQVRSREDRWKPIVPLQTLTDGRPAENTYVSSSANAADGPARGGQERRSWAAIFHKMLHNVEKAAPSRPFGWHSVRGTIAWMRCVGELRQSLFSTSHGALHSSAASPSHGHFVADSTLSSSPIPAQY